MMYRVFTTLDEISTLKEAWNKLSDRSPFQSWEWFYSWYQSFGDELQPFVVIDETEGQTPTLIAPMYVTQSRVGTIKLCLAGDGNVCTDNNQVITAMGLGQYSITKFVHWLASSPEAQHLDFAEFDGVALNSESTEDLLGQMSVAGFDIDQRELESCWVTQLEESWEKQNATFSKKHRRKTKKAVSNLDQSDLLDSSTCEFDELWEKFVELHQKRRTSLGEPGCFADSRFGGFLKSAAQRLIARDMAEIIVIQRKQVPVAATIEFFVSTTTFMYQTGFDPAYSNIEPGYMLIVAAIKRAIDKGHKRFDFMRGNEAYKARWNASPEPLVRLNFCLNRRFKSQLHSFLRSSKLIVKSSLKSLKFV